MNEEKMDGLNRYTNLGGSESEPPRFVYGSGIKEFVDAKYPRFGETKRQEITRLLYEIAKRDKLDVEDILRDFSVEPVRFDPLKSYLLKRRFPKYKTNVLKIRAALPKVEINPRFEARFEKKEFYPKYVYIEEAVTQTSLAQRIKQKFPESKFETISSYREYVKTHSYDLAGYNDRLDYCFLTQEKFDFFKNCPCSPKSVSCGYHIVNLGVGCSYECMYCFLPAYLNSPGIQFPANLEDFFDAFKAYHQDIRVGSGEFADSLVFDHITEYSPQIVEFFKDYPKATFEFKTKSVNIDLLTSVKPAGNIAVAWTVNPKDVAKQVECLTPSIDERLNAAVRCQAAGYKIGFHFDPVIHYEGWEKDYEQLVNEIFDKIEAKNIAWISLGTLRMTMGLKKTIENRFPHNTILDEEMFLGYDDKIRYAANVRQSMYEKMFSFIRRRSQKVWVYLCMEEKGMCGKVVGA